MEKFLSDNKIEYIFYHLNMVLDLNEALRSRFAFYKNGKLPEREGQIIFCLSEKSFDPADISYKEGLPVFYPVLEHDAFYRIENKCLIFHDDLLKACFFLLSGYQEINPKALDSFGRFPHEESIQNHLNFTCKPLVNYFFEIITKALKEFAVLHDIEIRDKQNFEGFCFFLSHDVDRVDTYTAFEVGYALKQALGIAAISTSRLKAVKNALKYILNYLNVFSRKNPHWDFGFHRELEDSLGLKSSYYFLPKGVLHHDAYYSFGEKRIQDLVKELRKNGYEIGLHGTVRTSKSARFLKNDYNYFTEHLLHKAKGIRQHRLLYDRKQTPSIQESVGLKYDTSLGFAEHEGFRNSFCLPFRLYDHENDRMLQIWEIPLVAMDVTLFSYQKYNLKEAENSLMHLIEETKKFSGVFSLLWHNGNFDETFFPGSMNFYKNLLKQISQMEIECLTGEEIISRMEAKK